MILFLGLLFAIGMGTDTRAEGREIPDRFNTGAGTGSYTDTELTKVTEEGNYGGIEYRIGAGGQLVLDLVYRNKTAGRDILVENMDFSKYSLLMVNENKITEETVVTYKNCRFDAVTTGREDAKIRYVFEDCTLRNFHGSNALPVQTGRQQRGCGESLPQCGAQRLLYRGSGASGQ